MDQRLTISPARLVISTEMGQVLLGLLFPIAPILQILNITRGLIPLSSETDPAIFQQQYKLHVQISVPVLPWSDLW